mgnify:CR=1 FL=1
MGFAAWAALCLLGGEARSEIYLEPGYRDICQALAHSNIGGPWCEAFYNRKETVLNELGAVFLRVMDRSSPVEYEGPDQFRAEVRKDILGLHTGLSELEAALRADLGRGDWNSDLVLAFDGESEFLDAAAEYWGAMAHDTAQAVLDVEVASAQASDFDGWANAMQGQARELSRVYLLAQTALSGDASVDRAEVRRRVDWAMLTAGSMEHGTASMHYLLAGLVAAQQAKGETVLSGPDPAQRQTLRNDVDSVWLRPEQELIEAWAALRVERALTLQGLRSRLELLEQDQLLAGCGEPFATMDIPRFQAALEEMDEVLAGK